MNKQINRVDEGEDPFLSSEVKMDIKDRVKLWILLDDKFWIYITSLFRFQDELIYENVICVVTLVKELFLF